MTEHPLQNLDKVMADISGVGGLVIDGAAQPLNLLPAVTALSARIQKVSQNLRHGRPLIVLLSEFHDQPADIMLQTLLIKEMLKHNRDRMACGLEYPHDGLGRLMASCGFSVDPASYPVLAARDGDGQRALLVSQAVFGYDEAPVAHDTFLDLCRSEKISTRFLDASKTDGARYLNHQDRLTAAAIKQYLPPEVPVNSIPCSSNMGTALRNTVIAHNALSHIQDSNADIYFLTCGIDHVLGNVKEGCRYEHSLSALFRQMGFCVMPVFKADAVEITKIPLQAQECFADMVLVTGFDQTVFRMADQGEAAYLKTLLSQAGTNVVPFEKESENHKALIEKLKAEGPSWLAPAVPPVFPHP